MHLRAHTTFQTKLCPFWRPMFLARTWDRWICNVVTSMACLFVLQPCLMLQPGLAVLTMRETHRASYSIKVIFDPEQATDSLFVHVALLDENTIYVLAMDNPHVEHVLCRRTVTTPVVIAPRGCDHHDPSMAIERSNCGLTPDFEEQWPYLIGPMRSIQTGKTSFDAFQALAGAYITSGVGPRCAIPAVTYIDIERSVVRLETNCSFIQEGDYDTNTNLAQARGTYHFIHGAYSLDFTHETGENYTMRFSDPLATDDVRVPEVSFNTTRVIPSTHNETTSCWFTPWFLVREPRLIPPAVRTGSNYYKNPDDVLYRTKACGFGVSKREFETGLTELRGIPEGIPYGGYPLLYTKDGMPIQVTKDDRFADFSLDCARFYPPGETFYGSQGTAGPLYERAVPASFSCFAPFPYLEQIIEVDTMDVRAKQCKMLGGVLATDGMDVCQMDSWRTKCRKGWLFFDERCWYKFDLFREGNLRVAGGPQSERLCISLNPHATASFRYSTHVSAWLQRFFVFFNTIQTTFRTEYDDQYCECFNGETEVRPCHCQDPNFPLCSYHHKDDPIFWSEIDYHPRTLEAFRDGQTGVDQGLHQLTCKCLPGSTGPECAQPTCIPEVTFLNETMTNPLMRFFEKCYRNKRGFCKDNDPFQCQCSPGFAPPGDMSSTEFPCMCPSMVSIAPSPETVFINGESSLSVHGICGFSKRGSCVVDEVGTGHCECSKRLSRFHTMEDAYTGRACECLAPHHLGSTTSISCNGHGTCCPSGLRADGSPGICPSGFNGCFCDPGYAGTACTGIEPVPVPLDAISFSKGNTRVHLEVTANVLHVIAPGASSVATKFNTSRTDCSLSMVRDQAAWNCSHSLASEVIIEGSTPHVEVFADDFGACGVFPNLYSARFFGGFDDWGEFEFARQGSTNGPCFCDPNNLGRACNTGISAIVPDVSRPGLTIPLVCGEATEPPRGRPVIAPGGKDRCRCGTLGTFAEFTGQSCECAVVHGEVCAGRGTCVQASFPYGACSQDTTEGDPLHFPFSNTHQKPTIVKLLDSHSNVTWFNGTMTGFQVGTTIEVNLILDIHGDNLSIGGSCYDLPYFQEDVFPARVCFGRHEITQVRQRISPVGGVDCSDPIQRNVDHVFNLGVCEDFPVSNTSIGVGFGMFSWFSPWGDFSLEEWTQEHYDIFSVILGNCTQADLRPTMWYDYIERIWSPYILGVETYGIPNLETDRIRYLDVVAPAGLAQGARLIHRGPSSFVTGGVFHAMDPGKTYRIYNSYASFLNFTLDPPEVLVVGGAFRNDSSAYPVSVRSVFNMLGNLEPVCQGQGGKPLSRADLRDIFRVYFAQRRCSSDMECSLFETTTPSGTCVFPRFGRNVPWRNGPRPAQSQRGDEGGCECSSPLFDPLTFCSTCIPGYGPLSNHEFHAMATFPVDDWAPTWNVEPCSLPVNAMSTRSSTVCSGKGFPRREVHMESHELRVYPNSRAFRRCEALRVGDDMFYMLQYDTAMLDLMTYVSWETNRTLVVYEEEIYGGTLEESPVCVVPEALDEAFIHRSLFTLFYD